MQEENQKAVDKAIEVLKADLEETKSLLEKANETIAAYEKAQAEHKQSVRKAELEKAVNDAEKVEALLKSTADLDDEAFATIVSTLVEKAEQIEKSDLFEKKSEQSPIEKADEAPLHVQILKEKYNKQ